MLCPSGCAYLLLGGSPAVIANLWDVSDRDIDRFGKAVLNSWLQQQHADFSPSHNQLIRDFGIYKHDDDKNTVHRKKSSRGSKKLLDLGNNHSRKKHEGWHASFFNWSNSALMRFWFWNLVTTIPESCIFSARSMRSMKVFILKRSISCWLWLFEYDKEVIIIFDPDNQ